MVIANSPLQGKGGEIRDQEITCRCGKPAKGEEAIDLGNVNRNTVENCADKWGLGERVKWIGLAQSYLLLLRALELFAYDKGPKQEIYSLW